MKLTPYLSFSGNCEEALNFYAKIFNGEIKNLSRFEGSPAESMSEDKQKILHANFEADGLSFMASDGGKGVEGDMVHLSINFDDVEDQQKIFENLSQGGKVTMPLEDAFWGARFGMLTDKYGINWMVNCEIKKGQ
ncbi:MAG: VOC family protein [Chitinophagaceae bacterium]